MGLPFNWSFSSLMKYEACPQQFKFARIDKLPELPRPPDNPMERGNRVHKRLEDYVNGTSRIMDHEAKRIGDFISSLDHLRELHACGMATAEQDWIYDRDWNDTDKKNPDKFLWAKLDACVQDETNGIAIAVDYKTGKSQYKQLEHVQQLQLYAALTALKFPWANTIFAELWYLDEGHVRQSRYSREQALAYVGRFDIRAQRIYDDRFYRPNPNVRTCRFCPYGPKNGTGVCPVGV
jgi:RecB family exonuclease